MTYRTLTADAFGRFMGWVDPERLNKTNSKNDGDAAQDAPEGQDVNLITSMMADHVHLPKEHRSDRYHRPVLDIDFEARLLPSSTPGHSHLYLDGITVPHDLYMYLLDVLAQCGIIQPKYAEYSRERGYTAVRKPGDYKPAPPPEDGAYQPKQMIRAPVMAQVEPVIPAPGPTTNRKPKQPKQPKPNFY